jgi:hypothetical protein
MDVHPTKNVSIGIDPYLYIIINDKDIRTIKDLWNGLCDLSARYTTSKPFQLAAGLLER